MADILNMGVGELKKLTATDYNKEANKSAVWNKADAVIFLKNLVLNKKIDAILPYKKRNLMIDEYKALKKSKAHKLALTAGCTLEVAGKELIINILKGGMKTDFVQAIATEFWGKQYEKITITGTSDDAGEAEAEGSEEAPSTTAPETKETPKSGADAVNSVIAVLKEIGEAAKSFAAIVDKVKQNKADAKDAGIVKGLLDLFERLKAAVTQAGSALTGKAAEENQKATTGFLPQVQKVWEKVQKLASEEPKKEAKNGDLAKTLEAARKKVKDIAQEIDKLDKTMDKMPSSFLPSGKAILGKLGL